VSAASEGPFDQTIAARLITDPWQHARGASPIYLPDYELLEELVSIPVSDGAAAATGSLAASIDAWLAQELRRAGFHADEVWPRATPPRVMSRDISVLLDELPKAISAEVRARLPKMTKVTPSSANILGRAYDKQVDVVIARWDRGPEVMVSTKSQMSSFAKNLPNRFEEAYGDAGNLRARYPLAAVGFLFVQRAHVRTREPQAFERTIDMMRKLRDVGTVGNGYTATALVLVDWDEPVGPTTRVRVVHDDVPDDIAMPQFMTSLVDTVLAVTPVQHHVAARSLRERRNVDVDDVDEA
jgi:hypothetical protein